MPSLVVHYAFVAFSPQRCGCAVDNRSCSVELGVTFPDVDAFLGLTGGRSPAASTNLVIPAVWRSSSEPACPARQIVY